MTPFLFLSLRELSQTFLTLHIAQNLSESLKKDSFVVSSSDTQERVSHIFAMKESFGQTGLEPATPWSRTKYATTALLPDCCKH